MTTTAATSSSSLSSLSARRTLAGRAALMTPASRDAPPTGAVRQIWLARRMLFETPRHCEPCSLTPGSYRAHVTYKPHSALALRSAREVRRESDTDLSLPQTQPRVRVGRTAVSHQNTYHNPFFWIFYLIAVHHKYGICLCVSLRELSRSCSARATGSCGWRQARTLIR